jgi:hypothetical protein
MCDGLGHGSWCKQTTNLFWDKSHQQPIEFYSRNILICAKWLLKQKGYQHDLVYAPEKRFNKEGFRLYNEMHTANWWWETQVCYI